MAGNFAAGLLLVPVLVLTPITIYGATHNLVWDQFTNYSSWASKSVKVGDSMVFIYNTPIHSLLVVSKAAYIDCDTSNPSFNDSSGNTTYKLTKEGAVYFICGTEVFCPGMQLQLNVKAVSSNSPSSSPTVTKNEAPGHGFNWLVWIISLVLGTLFAFV